MQAISKVFDWIARNVLLLCFIIFAILSLVIKGMYDFEDFPYFMINKWYDYVTLIVIGIFTYFIYRYRDILQHKVNYWIGFAFFMILSAALIYFVPLTPFSDMGHVYQGACKFASFQWSEIMNDSYWSMFPGNTYLSVFLGILMIPFPKTLFSIKIINALIIYGSIYFTAKIAEILKVKYYRIVYLVLIFFSPLILYVNHIYFDTIFLFLALLCIYCYFKKRPAWMIGIILGVMYYIRVNALIFFAAIAICMIFEIHKKESELMAKKVIKTISCILIMLVLMIGIDGIGKHVVEKAFSLKDYPSYSIWNQFYIGINEEEFGFMDGDFDYDRDAQDILERIQEYGPVRTAKLLCKKNFWLWTQGTYQAERYSFGSDTDQYNDKFEYETVMTKYLLNNNQKLRKLINSLMRAQYLVLFYMMVYEMCKKKDIRDMRILYYIMMATFLVMMIYELKSRYILQCLPIMVILAIKTFEKNRE